MSRRQFIRAAAGATGGILSAEIWMPVLAHAGQTGAAEPRPIPGGVQPLGPNTEVFHVFLPGLENEPSTITDFSGTVGIAHIRGTGTGKSTKTDEKKQLIFDVDMRFMEGRYIGVDGNHHHGTFGFVWLDLYEGQVDPEHQIHDFNPGITPSGLFWTIPISPRSVRFTSTLTEARMKVQDLAVRDAHDLINALKRGPSVPATVSFDVHWSGVLATHKIKSADHHYRGQFVTDMATIEWSAKESRFEFVSDPANTSKSQFAMLGFERNGVFFSHD